MQLYITIGDIIAFTLAAILFLFIIGITLHDVIKQKLCSHEEFYESGSCDAICKKCHKNLGFIGLVKEQRSIK